MAELLTEKWSELIDAKSNVSPEIAKRENIAQLLESQEKFLKEDNVQGDIAQYTPLILPAVKRTFPNLLANEIVGVQPLKQSTGLVFALRYFYGDAGTGSGTGNYKGIEDNSRGDFTTNPATPLNGAAADFRTVGIIFDNIAALPTSGSNVIFSSGATGVCWYSEPGRALIKFTSSAAAALAVTPGVSATGTGTQMGAGQTKVIAGFQNEAGYNLLFPHFIARMTTADGEYALGAGGAMNKKTLQFSIEKAQVTAMSRKLKAGYTLELAQDLKNQHGEDAEKLLINIMEYEIAAELDRELVDLINSKAIKTATWTYGAVGNAAGTADGRWEAEKIRTLYNRLLREANQVALTTRKGSANFIIASSNVVAALETLQGFMYASVPGAIKPAQGVAKVGTLDGRFTVYMDTFAFTDYITLGFKGSSNYDSGIIYCPYIPLQMQKVIDPDTMQPKIGFMTRDAFASNLYGAQNYYRTFQVDFTGSSFGGSYFDSLSGNYTAW